MNIVMIMIVEENIMILIIKYSIYYILNIIICESNFFHTDLLKIKSNKKEKYFSIAKLIIYNFIFFKFCLSLIY